MTIDRSHTQLIVAPSLLTAVSTAGHEPVAIRGTLRKGVGVRQVIIEIEPSGDPVPVYDVRAQQLTHGVRLHAAAVSDAVLLDDVRRVAKLRGGVITAAFYERLGNYSCDTVRERLGRTWKEIAARAGVLHGSLPKGLAHHNYVSADMIADELRRLHKQLGRSLRWSDLRRESRYSDAVIRRRFGSWADAAAYAGVPYSGRTREFRARISAIRRQQLVGVTSCVSS